MHHANRPPFSVFPTRVGMVRAAQWRGAGERGFPHPRGDGPIRRNASAAAGLFSPPAWGWSDVLSRAASSDAVFPTRVGMVRAPTTSWKPVRRFPHPRGDGPLVRNRRRRRPRFSPPAWGWSAILDDASAVAQVFPTRVGMVRHSGSRFGRFAGFPHPRGDGPLSRKPDRSGEPFFPPAWGWSALVRAPAFLLRVFPTRVGMVRAALRRPRCRCCFPHPRGDGPTFDGTATLRIRAVSQTRAGAPSRAPHDDEAEGLFPWLMSPGDAPAAD